MHENKVCEIQAIAAVAGSSSSAQNIDIDLSQKIRQGSLTGMHPLFWIRMAGTLAG